MDKIIKQLVADKKETDPDMCHDIVAAYYQDGLEDMLHHLNAACNPDDKSALEEMIKGCLRAGRPEDIPEYMAALIGAFNEGVDEFKQQIAAASEELDQLKAQVKVYDIERRAALLELETIKEQLKRIV